MDKQQRAVRDTERPVRPLKQGILDLPDDLVQIIRRIPGDERSPHPFHGLPAGRVRREVIRGSWRCPGTGQQAAVSRCKSQMASSVSASWNRLPREISSLRTPGMLLRRVAGLILPAGNQPCFRRRKIFTSYLSRETVLPASAPESKSVRLSCRGTSTGWSFQLCRNR